MPLVGTWIEISYATGSTTSVGVVPLVGTWIEIYQIMTSFVDILSCPSWARGLKFNSLYLLISNWSRAPRGHVD